MCSPASIPSFSQLVTEKQSKLAPNGVISYDLQQNLQALGLGLHDPSHVRHKSIISNHSPKAAEPTCSPAAWFSEALGRPKALSQHRACSRQNLSSHDRRDDLLWAQGSAARRTGLLGRSCAGWHSPPTRLRSDP